MNKGQHLYTITLNYCSTLGLIEAGVLPKPGLWQHHRMKHGAPKPENAPKPKKMRDTANGDKEVEVFELLESDDEN